MQGGGSGPWLRLQGSWKAPVPGPGARHGASSAALHRLTKLSSTVISTYTTSSACCICVFLCLVVMKQPAMNTP